MVGACIANNVVKSLVSRLHNIQEGAYLIERSYSFLGAQPGS